MSDLVRDRQAGKSSADRTAITYAMTTRGIFGRPRLSRRAARHAARPIPQSQAKSGVATNHDRSARDRGFRKDRQARGVERGGNRGGQRCDRRSERIESKVDRNAQRCRFDGRPDGRRAGPGEPVASARSGTHARAGAGRLRGQLQGIVRRSRRVGRDRGRAFREIVVCAAARHAPGMPAHICSDDVPYADGQPSPNLPRSWPRRRPAPFPTPRSFQAPAQPPSTGGARIEGPGWGRGGGSRKNQPS